MDRHRVEDALDRRAAFLARGHRVVGHPLEDLEVVAVAAAVLVDRHSVRIIPDRLSGPGRGLPLRGRGMGFHLPTDRVAAPRAVVLGLLALAALALLLIPARAHA